jgi:hypothetical protein
LGQHPIDLAVERNSIDLDLMSDRRCVWYGQQNRQRVIGDEILKPYDMGLSFGHRQMIDHALQRNRSLSGVLLPPGLTRNNPSPVHQGGGGSDQGDSEQHQVAAA